MVVIAYAKRDILRFHRIARLAIILGKMNLFNKFILVLQVVWIVVQQVMMLQNAQYVIQIKCEH